MKTSTTLQIFDRIVCGVDGTAEALEAARQAERLRSPERTLRLIAVTEVNTAVHAGFAMSHALAELDAASREGLLRAIGEVEPASAQLLEGNASRSLLDELERKERDPRHRRSQVRQGRRARADRGELAQLHHRPRPSRRCAQRAV